MNRQTAIRRAKRILRMRRHRADKRKRYAVVFADEHYVPPSNVYVVRVQQPAKKQAKTPLPVPASI